MLNTSLYPDYMDPTPKREERTKPGFSDKVTAAARKVWENKATIIPIVVILAALTASILSPGQLSEISSHYDVYITYAVGVAIIAGGAIAHLMDKKKWVMGLIALGALAIIATTLSFILSSQAKELISSAINPFNWKVVVAAGVLGASPLIGYGLHSLLKERPKPVDDDGENAQVNSVKQAIKKAGERIRARKPAPADQEALAELMEKIKARRTAEVPVR